MLTFGRRRLLLGVSALTLGLAGCNQASGGGAVTGDDVVLGEANAPVTLIEYASSTCPHCADFHEDAFERLKTNYIDTGRVRYVFREFPTPPADVAVAGFQLARCGGASSEQYFARLGELFRTQAGMRQALMTNNARQYFINMGDAAGLNQDQVLACVADQDGAERVQRIVEAGVRDFRVDSTPTFVIDGRKVEGIGDYESLARALDAALAN